MKTIKLCLKNSFLAFSAVIAVLAFIGCEQQQIVSMINYDQLTAMKEDKTAMKKITLIDIRSPESWLSGYIEPAINIPYDTFIGRYRNLIDDGTALTSIMTNKDRTLILYGSEDEDAELFARKASSIGYTDVLLYAGGIEDWKQHGDFLVLDYTGFKAWYDAFCPFDDDQNYLIDVDDKEVYSDYGHIPGAINIVGNYYVTNFGKEPSDITLDDVMLDKNSKVVMYCVYDT
jgi:rhodanese-related sulfurtransferase